MLIFFVKFKLLKEKGMPAAKKNILTPTEQELISPMSEEVPDEKVQLKKQLGLLEGVAVILGIIFGSGKL